MLWINEGFVLDDAGNLLTTNYIDLRCEKDRTVIHGLVKGCQRQHALEDGETVLISKPERFREFGAALIRDEQEGFAKEEQVTLGPETPEEAARRRATEDLNGAFELVGSSMKMERRVEYSRQATQSRNFSYGKDWWIFCTSIKPEESDWDAWRASLDDDYDHVTEIGRPAQFAQALARMVTEQVGPLGEEAWISGTDFGKSGARTLHTSQTVIHGPVVYTERLYEMLSAEEDDVKRFAACLFAKPVTHAAQREYRFVMLNGGAAEQTVQLRISGMMRDALAHAESGLIRPSPAATEMIEDDGAPMSRPVKGSQKVISRRRTTRMRKRKREERRSEARDAEGQVLSTDTEWHESVEERISREDFDGGGQGGQRSHRTKESEPAELPAPVLNVRQEPEEHGDKRCEDAVAKEVAAGEREWNDEFGGDGLSIPVVHQGSGRTFRSVKEMFEDPTAPMSPFASTWEASACSPEEIVKSYGAVATLAMKVSRVSVEHRQEAASACWYALQCIGHIHARLGDIVDSVWIERERFVVIHVKKSKALKATGRIVIGPSGGYAYCLKSSESEKLGYTEGHLGQLFFPLGHDVETFESFGWSGKLKRPDIADDEMC